MANEPKAAPPDKAKKKKERSPSYPALGLETAIQKCRVIYDHEKRNATTFDVIAGHWKSNAKSSSALQAIAALKYYGLIVEMPSSNDARHFKLSDSGLRILLDQPDSAGRIAAIKAAALTPKLHHELWEKWGMDLPSDPSIRSFLLLDKHFNEGAVNSFIKQYRDTISFANLTQGDKLPAVASGIGEREEEPRSSVGSGQLMEKPPADPPNPPKGSVVRDLTFPLMDGGVAILRAPIPMSKENFDLLESMLKAMKKGLVKPENTDNKE